MWRPVCGSLLPLCISRQTSSDLSGQFNVTFECPHIHSPVIPAMVRPIPLSPLNPVVPVFGTMHFHQHDVCGLSAHINVLRVSGGVVSGGGGGGGVVLLSVGCLCTVEKKLKEVFSTGGKMREPRSNRTWPASELP